MALKTSNLEHAMLVHPEAMSVGALADKIRKIENWPQKGILFHDITPVLQSAEYFRLLVDLLVYRYMDQKIDIVAGLDARGFIIGAALAYQLNVGFVPIRKKGKLPFETVSQSYALEYGEAAVEIHTDAVKPGSRVLLVDRFGCHGRHDACRTGADPQTRRGNCRSRRHFGIYRPSRRQEYPCKRRALIYPASKRRLYEGLKTDPAV